MMFGGDKNFGKPLILIDEMIKHLCILKNTQNQTENAAEVVEEVAVVAEVAEVGAAEEEEEEEEEEMTMERLNALDRSELNALAKEHGVTGSTKTKKIEGIAMKLKIGDYEESGGDRDGI